MMTYHLQFFIGCRRVGTCQCASLFDARKPARLWVVSVGCNTRDSWCEIHRDQPYVNGGTFTEKHWWSAARGELLCCTRYQDDPTPREKEVAEMTLTNGRTASPVYAVVRGVIDEPGKEWIDTATCGCSYDVTMGKWELKLAECPNNPCNQSMPFLRVGLFHMVEVHP